MNIFGRMKALIKIQAEVGRFQNQVKGQDMASLFKNWKTTLAGLISVVTVIGSSLGFLQHDQATMITALAASFGLMAAKDGNVTGGTKQQ